MVSKKMSELFGKSAPRYSFILNPYSDYRASTCPKCDKAMYGRKFPLLIIVKDTHPIALGLTCKYCSKCELIVAHKYDLEEQLCLTFEEINSKCIGNEYLVVGTVDRKKWKASIGTPSSVKNMLEFVSDFKEVLTLMSHPKGYWREGT